MKWILFTLSLSLLVGCISVSKFDRGRFYGPETETYELTFESIDGLIIIEAKFNGVKGRFLLDNGFSISAFDDDFAEKLNINPSKTATVSDANNKRVELGETKIKSITIGPFKLNNSFANQLDTDKFLPCDNIDGVIGANFINHVNWKIDFENKRITLSSLPYDIKGHTFPIERSLTNISFTELRIDGKPVRAMIDFGYQGYIKVRKAEFYDTFLGDSAEVRVGITSLSVSGLGNIDTSFVLRDVAIAHADHNITPTQELVVRSKLKEPAVIGINYFENYTLYVNSTNQEYVLKDRVNYTPDIPNNYNVVLYLIDGKIKVIQRNGSDSTVKNVPLLAEVISIDNQPASSITTVCELRSYMKHARENDENIVLFVYGIEEPIILQAKEVPIGIVE